MGSLLGCCHLPSSHMQSAHIHSSRLEMLTVVMPLVLNVVVVHAWRILVKSLRTVRRCMDECPLQAQRRLSESMIVQFVLAM